MKKMSKKLVSVAMAVCLIFGMMTVAFAGVGPEISVNLGENNQVTITGSGFEAAQEVGIITLKPGTENSVDIDVYNPITSIDYIDQVTTDVYGGFELTYTTSGVEGSYKVLATDVETAGSYTVEVTAVAGGIKGKVTALSNNDQITVTIKDDDEVVTTVNPDSTGAFEVIDLDAGTYSVVFSKPSYLKLTITGVVVVAEEDTMLADEVLLAGDQNNDGAINASDLGALLSAWNTVFGGGSFNSNVDFNEDNAVNASDLGQILTNWNKVDIVKAFSAN